MDTENTQQASLDETFLKQREHWKEEIERLNEMMKTLPQLNDLLNIIYAKRQDAVDVYYRMNSIILKQSKEYHSQYVNMFNNIKINGFNGIRYSSDQMISRQIENELQDKKEIIDLLTNQNNYIKETIATLDNMIFGVTQKVKIQEMINGMKF